MWLPMVDHIHAEVRRAVCSGMQGVEFGVLAGLTLVDDPNVSMLLQESTALPGYH